MTNINSLQINLVVQDIFLLICGRLFSKVFFNDDWYPSRIFFTNPSGLFASFLKSVSVFEHLNSDVEKKTEKKILVLINKMSDTDNLQEATGDLQEATAELKKTQENLKQFQTEQDVSDDDRKNKLKKI